MKIRNNCPASRYIEVAVALNLNLWHNSDICSHSTCDQHKTSVPFHTMPNVILLRTPAESPSDPYEAALHGASLNAFSIPVLETSFVNLPHLQSLISDGPQCGTFAGVIITSKRSCEAWTAAVKSLFASLLRDDDVSRTKLKASLGWSSHYST